MQSPSEPLPPDLPAPGSPVAAQKNGASTVSLILGILAFLLQFVAVGFIPGIIAIIVGNNARKSIKKSNGLQTGDRSAKTGVILGWVSIIMSAISLCVGIAALMVYVFTCGGAPVC
ncbi:MAG TPA: DUF4190 domain-containing protein [Thermoflexales bacterium]|jgi:hypothetical protein|nr:DUF4190 domain-containing protein [Thermoflexales bacterium]HQX08833.1 DUF4190 domain-containing protein [Thermoflexales bacterium]HQY23705.1 DUF4190 domain-containing protein [Thermoflexales bacterium]HQZ51953.1 DUF4190 domain-containing protein [Thermoflexales bacterium]HRA52122.1 DUF4190 domain-containing protein [Thermoflexales bacterium]